MIAGRAARRGRRRRRQPGMSRTARQALGYKELLDHLEGRIGLDEAVAAIVTRTRQFAVRQERWFRRDPRVRWIDVEHDPVAEAAPAVIDALLRDHDRTRRSTKHHGLGNDFLVVFRPATSTTSPALARRVCDRRRGIGADGLLVGESRRRPRRAAMALYNADGSRAEMSGNGIRCFAQALAPRRGDLAAADDRSPTPASARVELHADRGPATRSLATVDMGAVVDDRRARRVGRARRQSRTARSPTSAVGNPHTVVGVDDVAAVDLLALGRQRARRQPRDRRAGPGAATPSRCASTSAAPASPRPAAPAPCAAAWAAARWGLVDAGDSELVVHMDGGSARVALAPARSPGASR